MISTSSHKIQTIVLDIHFEGFEIGLGTQDDLADYFYVTIQPEMEKIMDAKAGKESYLKIKELSLDCGTIPYEHWQKTLVDTVKRNLSFQLQALSGTKIPISENLEGQQWDTLIYFLDKGHYPWSSSLSAGAVMLIPQTLTKTQLYEFAGHYKNSSHFSNRFTASVSPKVKASLLKSFIKHGDSFTKHLSKVLLGGMDFNSKYFNWVFHSINDVFETYQSIPLTKFMTTLLSHTDKSKEFENKGLAVLAESMIKMSNENPSSNEVFKTVFEAKGNKTFQQNRIKMLQLLCNKTHQLDAGKKYREWISQLLHPNQQTLCKHNNSDYPEVADLIPNHQKTKPDQPHQDDIDDDALYINNAGMVILHPFLPEFFKEIEGMVIEDKKSVCLDTCLEILQYLVYGVNEHSEQYYPFNKILCGRNIEDVFVPSRDLSENVKDKADAFLNEVISHWEVLRNPSLEAFRETFLQRNGKLTKVNKGWKLEVEKKGVDILMGSLPWGLSIIKLPWTQKIIYVEWN